MNRKNFCALLVFVIIIVAIVIGRRGPDSGAAEPIKIGASLALSGKFAYIGESERNGMLLAIEEINAKGGVSGRPLELVYEDNEADAATAVTGTIKLLGTDKVDVFFTGFTHITQAIKALVTDAGKVLIYASSVREIASESSLMFSDHIDGVRHGATTLKAVAQAGHDTIGLVAGNDEVCQTYLEGANGGAVREGVEIVHTEEYAQSDKDIRTVLAKFKQHAFGALVACSWNSADVLMRQWKELGMIDTPVYVYIAPFLPHGDTTEMRALYEESGTVSTWYGVTETVTDQMKQEFVKKYEARFPGSKASGDATFAYDDMYALATALGPCATDTDVDSECLSRELLKTDMNGVGGRMTFDATGASVRDVLLMRVVDGKWEEI